MRYKEKPFFAGNIPTIDIGLPIFRRYVQFELGWGVQWGFTHFYIDQFPDLLPSAGLRIYPFGKYLSFYGKGKWSTYVFNNNTLTAECGGNLDIPLGESGNSTAFLSLGGGYFTRKVTGLSDIVDREKHGSWYITSHGPMFSLTLLFRSLRD